MLITKKDILRMGCILHLEPIWGQYVFIMSNCCSFFFIYIYVLFSHIFIFIS